MFERYKFNNKKSINLIKEVCNLYKILRLRTLVLLGYVFKDYNFFLNAYNFPYNLENENNLSSNRDRNLFPIITIFKNFGIPFKK